VDRSRIAIVIPALNEARTIGAVVVAVRGFGMPVVVDDGSSDATAEQARSAGADVVVHAVNRGYDAALNSGFARAAERGCEYVVTVDADGQHNAQQIGDFITLLDSGYQLVLGVRDRHQRLAERIFARVSRRCWGLSDPLCGMKAYHMALYRQQRVFDSFGSIGTELAVRSAARGARRVEQATRIRDRADSPRFGRRLAANLRILRAMCILLCLDAAGRLARVPA
jgi:glycosyltransferase involved in cell wall biosynthesis